MSVVWSLLCREHREVLTTGRFFPGHVPTSPNKIEELRQRLHDYGNTQEERVACARLFDLIVAFVERHRDCDLETQHGLGLLNSPKARVAYSWVEYNVYEDGPFDEAASGKRHRISDRVLRDEVMAQKIREYETRGYEDKARLLDEYGDLDVLEYMKMQSLRSWASSADKTCTNCGTRMPVVFGYCPHCAEDQYWIP